MTPHSNSNDHYNIELPESKHRVEINVPPPRLLSDNDRRFLAKLFDLILDDEAARAAKEKEAEYMRTMRERLEQDMQAYQAKKAQTAREQEPQP